MGPLHKLLLLVMFCVLLVSVGFYLVTGPGWFARVTTISGVYTVIRPDSYDVACFGDSGHRDGGLQCIPCALINNCKKVN